MDWRDLWTDTSYGLTRLMDWHDLWTDTTYGLTRFMDWHDLWTDTTYGLTRLMDWHDLWTNTTYGLTRLMDWSWNGFYFQRSLVKVFFRFKDDHTLNIATFRQTVEANMGWTLVRLLDDHIEYHVIYFWYTREPCLNSAYVLCWLNYIYN